ncbi:hypothetical protein AVEN_213303-1 [Araneus ventricosus]|uniref:Uncharacterized protein n=1 Tax=Araneus ventricosus TaxID=182803 RepID=A0A4Y2KE88_ARAVE|nr:hypothetical protein AVEN_213303-1 [Araneus ventricosus]
MRPISQCKEVQNVPNFYALTARGRFILYLKFIEYQAKLTGDYLMNRVSALHPSRHESEILPPWSQRSQWTTDGNRGVQSAFRAQFEESCRQDGRVARPNFPKDTPCACSWCTLTRSGVKLLPVGEKV